MRAMGQRDKTIKVCLTNRGKDVETPWAQDLGPAAGKKGHRRVRLVNVPFLHAKPTWGDVVVVAPVDDGLPTWDRDGVAWKQIGTRIDEDGGRWAMIVDYVPRADDVTGDVAYAALTASCEAADIVCEGAWGPGKKPGRVYLAVRIERVADEVMKVLAAAKLPCELIQVHPSPAAVKAAPAKKAAPSKKAAPAKKKPTKKRS
jgi:hypothetical protein